MFSLRHFILTKTTECSYLLEQTANTMNKMATLILYIVVRSGLLP